MNSKPWHTSSRVVGSFSPIPPVKTSRSIPSISAAYEPTNFLIRAANISIASCAPGVPVLGGRADVAHVGRDVRDAQHTRLLVDHAAQTIQIQSLLLGDVDQRSGIGAAAPGPHNQAVDRSESHRRVVGLAVQMAVTDAAAADMAGHDLGMSVIDARQPAGHLRDVLVARTVKSVAAHAVLVVIPVGKRVHEVLGRHRLVERGVEHGDLRGIGQNVLHGQNTFQVGRIGAAGPVRNMPRSSA